MTNQTVFYRGTGTASELATTASAAIIIGGFLVTLYEFISRTRPHMYYNKLALSSHQQQQPPLPRRVPWMLGWAVGALLANDDDILRVGGLDAYMVVRFAKLCSRYCLFGTFVTSCVLTPLYLSGDGQGELELSVDLHLQSLTVAGIGHDTSYDRLRMWIVVGIAYIQCGVTMLLIKNECAAFLRLRTAYFVNSTQTQSMHTVMIEGLPERYRSSTTLTALFENLFPEQVHSAQVIHLHRHLSNTVKQREIAAARLHRFRSANRRYSRTTTPTTTANIHENTALLTGTKSRKYGYLLGCCSSVCSGVCGDQKSRDCELKAKVERLNVVVAALQDVARLEEKKENERIERLAAAQQPPPHWKTQQQQQQQQQQQHHPTTDQQNTPNSNNNNEQDNYVVRVEPQQQQQQQQENNNNNNNQARDSGYGALSKQAHVAVDGSNQRSNHHRSRRWRYAPSWAWSLTNQFWNVTRGLLWLPRRTDRSSTGFVTFKTRKAATIASQIHLTNESSTMKAFLAPEPRDIIWGNSHHSAAHIEIRTTLTSGFTLIGAVFWYSVVVSLVVVTNLDELSQKIKFLQQIPEDSQLRTALAGYLPVVALLLILVLVPAVFKFIALNYEGVKTWSGLSLEVTNRHFFYQIANVYVIATAHSFSQVLTEIVESPRSGLLYFGVSLPSAVSYFCQIIVLKLFCGLPFELLRPGLLFEAFCQGVGIKSYSKVIAVERKSVIKLMATPEPEWMYPNLLLIFTICAAYEVVAPVLVMPLGLLYFTVARLVYTHLAVHVFVPKYETGGKFWLILLPRLMVGVITGHVLLIAYLIAGSAFAHATALLPLPAVVYSCWRYCDEKYQNPGQLLSLQSAQTLDDIMNVEQLPRSFNENAYLPPWLSVRDIDV